MGPINYLKVSVKSGIILIKPGMVCIVFQVFLAVLEEMYGSSSGRSYWKHSERVIEEQIIQMIKYLQGGTLSMASTSQKLLLCSNHIRRFGLSKEKKTIQTDNLRFLSCYWRV